MDQKELWNQGARGWVASQGLIDEMFAPVEALLADAVDEAGAEHVLDIGCGTGATTVAAAHRVGDGGRCVGVDLSEVMVEAARARAERSGAPATFVCSDAATHAFDPEAADMLISRFGIMFFDDPVRAFTNLHGGLRAGGTLACITWRGPEENPFMTAAEQAAEPHLPGVSQRPPNMPGQFGLADAARTRAILTEAGWRGVDLAPVDIACAFPAAARDDYLTRLGPVGRALQQADESTRERVLDVARAALDPYVDGEHIRFTAALWRITARAAAR